MRISSRFATVAALVLSASVVLAADKPRAESTRKTDAGRQSAKKGGQKMAHGPQFERYVASCVISGNEGEVTLAKLAQQRASSQDVKAFADRMIKEHTAFTQKVQPFDSGRSAQRREGAADQNATAAGDGISVETLIQVNDEIHQRCLASAQRELQQKEGAEFDKCYMGAQVAAHMKMVDALSVLQNHVSGDFQQVLADGLQTSQKHLDQAKKIFADVDRNSGTAKTARKDAGAKK